MTLVLSQRWEPGSTDRSAPEVPDEEGRPGRFEFRLVNTGPEPVRIARLCYASMTRPGRNVQIAGARLTGRVANHVELTAPPDLTLAPGEGWDIVIVGLTHAPLNQSQGAMAAWGETDEGDVLPVQVESLRGDAPAGPRKDWPAGKVTLPLALLPWPADVQVAGWGGARLFSPGAGMDAAVFAAVAALHRRLFPNDASVFCTQGGTPVRAERADMAPESYRLVFDAAGAACVHGDADGLRNGLIALAQIAHGARVDGRFDVPDAGVIADAPRFGWRGTHVDVARNFLPFDDLMRLADILAWHRMNKLHLHLTDDEAWRLESIAFPELTQKATRRARGTALPPQYADGPDGQAGYYTQAEIRVLIARCDAFGIEVIPEIDLPGHTYALMSAIEGLYDPGEPWDCYRSVQGYPNNALNPALPRTYEVVGTLLDEVCALFPSRIVHVGGDEVDQRAWAQSPAANALRQCEDLADGAMPMQAFFLRRLQQRLHARGKIMAGWDECAEGGGVEREGTLLFAWRNVAQTAQLLEEGYDVVATPGQAYYLDMIQASGWDEPGTSWAGAVPPAQTYSFEVADGLGDATRLRGVQACIWAEHLNSRARWNYMVFPRLSAVAEAAWTPPGAKDWDRFCALSRLMPQL